MLKNRKYSAGRSSENSWLPQLIACSVAVICLAIHVATASAQFQDLVKRIPATANTIVIFNVEKILASPLAIKEDWRQKQQQAFASGMVLLPPQATHAVLASQLDLEFMHPIWEVAVLDLNTDASIEAIAKRRNGVVDEVAGVPAVALPDDTYLVEFSPRTVGRMAPANRQSVARWVRQSQTNAEVSLSPYITEAVRYAEEVGTEIIMGMDLQDAITAAVAREKLVGLQALAGQNVDIFTTARIIASMRGVTLGVVIGEKPFGKLKIDFAEDVTPIAGFVKPMLLEVLANQGALIDDFNDWKVVAKGRQVSIEGNLSATGMRQIFSVVDAPSNSMAADDAVADATAERSPGDTGGIAEASQQHFHAVTQLLGDLRRRDSSSIGQIGLFFTTYARKVDRLPILNVDEDLLAYSAWISQQLRGAAEAIQGIGIRSGERSAQVYGGRGFDSGGFRYGRFGAFGGGTAGYRVGVNTTSAVQAERRAIRAQEKAVGATDARAIMKDVEGATAEIRRTMTQRYQIEFQAAR